MRSKLFAIYWRQSQCLWTIFSSHFFVAAAAAAPMFISSSAGLFIEPWKPAPRYSPGQVNFYVYSLSARHLCRSCLVGQEVPGRLIGMQLDVRLIGIMAWRRVMWPHLSALMGLIKYFMAKCVKWSPGQLSSQRKSIQELASSPNSRHSRFQISSPVSVIYFLAAFVNWVNFATKRVVD